MSAATKKMSFSDFFSSRVQEGRPILFDGGMGTLVQAAQACDPSITYTHPEELVFTHSQIISRIHEQYARSGSDIITANTFGANPVKLFGCSFCALDAVTAAVSLAKKAAEKSDRQVFVALDLGPTGQLLEPMGNLTFEQAYESYKTAAIAGEKAGANLALIETISDLYEAKAAVLAVKEHTSLPVFVTMTFQDALPDGSLRTLAGSDVLTCVTCLEGLGVDALGFNCGGSLEDALRLSQLFAACTKLPVISQPNAGIPSVENGRTVFKVAPETFAAAQIAHYREGAFILGGCCGTTPEHIVSLSHFLHALDDTEKNVVSIKLLREKNAACVRVSSATQTVTLDEPIIIGERINPTGKPKCKEALRQRNLQYLADEASAQIEAGAHILDVNTGLPGIDEKALMLETVKLLQRTFQVPLQIDSDNPAVLEAAVRAYNGRPLINSVNGKKESMDAVLPLVKKYGCPVIALALDEAGIPQTAEGRVAVLRRIIDEAALYGIPKNYLIADALTLTVSSRQDDANETLKTVRLIKSELGIKTALGVSNVSFGLPRRDVLNAHFFTAALFAGLDACIINPLSTGMLDAFYSYRVFSGYDKNCLQYLELYTPSPDSPQTVSSSSLPSRKKGQVRSAETLYDIILNGFSSVAAEAAEKELAVKTPQEIIDAAIIPALDEAGKRYENGTFFLPQLLLCAEASSAIFGVLKAALKKSGAKEQSRGLILIATVYGDVHDIGKNIAKALLENYGYEVVDLGKNVPPETVAAKAAELNVRLVGLSALMTTTVANMKKTIELLRETAKKSGKKIAVMSGGAVLTESYAKEIGADFYVKDALAAVNVARQIFGS